MNSMTGFGRASAQLGDTDLAIEVHSLNRRNLEVQVSLPKEWQSLEKPISDEVRGCLLRGRVTVSVQICDTAGGGSLSIDEAGFAATLKTLRELAESEDVQFSPSPELLYQIACNNRSGPAMLDVESARAPVLECIREALSELLEMRRIEGLAIAADLESRVARTVVPRGPL
jgi:uncharacterized protein (TIGR00255 family)